MGSVGAARGYPSFKETNGTQPQKTTNQREQEVKVKLEVSQLKAIEREVKAHEQAHQSVGGAYAGGISYDYQEGPDGQRYITGGEVPIHTPEGKTSEDTIRIMEQVRRAALAPANPSPQDMKVAASATQKLMEAQTEQSQGDKGGKETQGKYHQAIQAYESTQSQYIKGKEKPTTIFDQIA